MAIVSSEIVEQHRQTDNRWDITEKHVDHLAKEYFINYLSEPGKVIETEVDGEIVITYEPPDSVATLLAQHALAVWDACVNGEEQMYLNQLDSGTLPDPALITINYTTRINVLKKLIRWMAKHNCIDNLKALHIYNYLKANYTAAQIATALGVTVTQVNAFLARFNIIDRDLKPVIEDDQTKVVDWGD